MTVNDFTYGYKVDRTIREKYECDGFPREGKQVYSHIVHATDGGVGLLAWMRGGERSEEYRRGIALFHRCIDPDGTITEVINPHNWVYHTGTGKAGDLTTIGTEFIKRSASFPTVEQYAAYVELLRFDLERFPVREIIGHNMYQKRATGVYTRPGRSTCPGAFDWDYLEMAIRAGIKCGTVRTKEQIVITK